MASYFIRPDNAHFKLESSSQTVDIVINNNFQKMIVGVTDSSYYNNVVSSSVNWTSSNQSQYNESRDIVLSYLTGSN